LKLDRAGIAALVPHAGAMCLLEEVLASDDGSITCRAISHRDATNPLRNPDGLAAIIGVEYAAQAVAVHGGLSSEKSSKKGGYLAALRDVICSVDRLDTERADLVVSATRVAAESGRLLYDFRIEGGGRELLRGRLSVVVVNEKSPDHGG
jgi:predicted hotdog family 3-hydroxylacyl-ACP dehydratase